MSLTDDDSKLAISKIHSIYVSHCKIMVFDVDYNDNHFFYCGIIDNNTSPCFQL